jgi:hypothetical protein
MRQILAIPIAFIMIISDMHLSFASHFCKGEMVASKWSFFGKNADCGMENNLWKCPMHNGISSDCCHNKIVYLTIENCVFPTTQFNDFTQKFVQVFTISNIQTLFQQDLKITLAERIRPPNNINGRVVHLSYICVFRI